MAHSTESLEIHLGAQGRVVIPASLRRALGIGAGDRLLVHLEDDRLIFEKSEAIKRRLKERFASVKKGISLADELVADRRKEADREIAR